MIRCPVINKECVFAFASARDNNIYCGQGKGDSNVKDVKSCDGKHPIYSNAFLKKLALHNKRVRMREEGVWL